jgi:hypothetical protein
MRRALRHPEIKIGGRLSVPAVRRRRLASSGKGVLAYVESINDRGGINGRKINYIAMDDAYSPPKAVEHVRKLVESDEVAFIFSSSARREIPHRPNTWR